MNVIAARLGEEYGFDMVARIAFMAHNFQHPGEVEGHIQIVLDLRAIATQIPANSQIARSACDRQDMHFFLGRKPHYLLGATAHFGQSFLQQGQNK